MTRILSVGYSKQRFARRNELLKARGYEVLEAGNQTVALEMIAAEHFDIVIEGISLPQAHRAEFATQIKLKKPDTPIIMLYDGSIQQTELADAILNVNGNADDLVNVIEYLLKKRAAEHTRANKVAG